MIRLFLFTTEVDESRNLLHQFLHASFFPIELSPYLVIVFLSIVLANTLNNEKELFRLIANDDEEAFARIFYHYTEIIYPFVLRPIMLLLNPNC